MTLFMKTNTREEIEKALQKINCNRCENPFNCMGVVEDEYVDQILALIEKEKKEAIESFCKYMSKDVESTDDYEDLADIIVRIGDGEKEYLEDYLVELEKEE